MIFELGGRGAERFQSITGLAVDPVTLRCLLDTRTECWVGSWTRCPDVRGEVRAAAEDELPARRQKGT